VKIGLLLLAAAGVTSSACSRQPTAAAPAPAAVTVARPIAKMMTEWDEFTGRLGAVASVEVRARVSGYLESTHFQRRRGGKTGRPAVRHRPAAI